MAQKKEQIRIEAEFDASKLSGKAKKAFDDLQRSTDKIDKSAKKATSSFEKLNTTVNNIGKASKNTTNSMVNNLRQVERQADKTTRSLEKLTGSGSGHISASGHGPMGSGMSGMDPLLAGLLANKGGSSHPAMKTGTLYNKLYGNTVRQIQNKMMGGNIIPEGYIRDVPALNSSWKLASKEMFRMRRAGQLPEELQSLDDMTFSGYARRNRLQTENMRAAMQTMPGEDISKSLRFRYNNWQIKRIDSALMRGTYGQNSMIGRWKSSGFDSKATLMGVGGMLLSQAMPEIARGFGANERQAQTATSVTQMATGSATAMAMLGPWGMVIGGLTGAATALVAAAKEQERASAALLSSQEDNQVKNARTYAKTVAAEKEQEEHTAFLKKVDSFKTDQASWEAGGDFILEAIKKEQENFARLDKMAQSSTVQMEAGLISGTAASGYASFQDVMQRRQKSKARITELQSLETSYWEDKHQRDLAIMEANAAEARRKREEAIKRAEAAQAEKERKDEEQRRAQYDYNISQSNKYAKYAESVSGVLSRSKSAGEDVLGRLSSYKLTDSLTSVGGGRGYGAQMNGVAKATIDINSKMNKVINKLTEIIDISKAKSSGFLETAAKFA